MNSGNRQADLLTQLGAPVEIDDVSILGATLVVAPHPDDESLGAGGTIARLREAGLPVHVLFVSDGSQSHPHSATYPASKLRELRKSEAIEALRLLGVSAEAATFLCIPDTQVPTPNHPGFVNIAISIADLIYTIAPKTVLVPWRRDPHRDHRATWQLINRALSSLTSPPRLLEYPIWLWELGQADDQPRVGEVQLFRLTIDSVAARKKLAIAAHRSQVTRLIDDDPAAFYLSPELLAHFDVPYELFFEAI